MNDHCSITEAVELLLSDLRHALDVRIVRRQQRHNVVNSSDVHNTLCHVWKQQVYTLQCTARHSAIIVINYNNISARSDSVHCRTQSSCYW